MSFVSLLNTVCTIELLTSTQDASGDMIKTWATLLTNVQCRIDNIGGGRIDMPDKIYEDSTHIIYMKNPSTITLSLEDHRIDVGGVKYMIKLVKQLYSSVNLSHLEIAVAKVD